MRALLPQDQWKKQRSLPILASSEGLIAVAAEVPPVACCLLSLTRLLGG